MRKTSAAESRLRQAATVPDILAASFDAFEITRLLARDSENAVPALFAAFMTIADAAVDGREAVTAAPSFPPGPSGQIGHDLPAALHDGLAMVTSALVALATLLGERLRHAADLATSTGDQAACQQALIAAGQIRHLMARNPDDCHLR